ncbi:MFS transporter [Shewanella waksmanii]|uniref:MFS transporter n=1 Tax=Shewanella waksmanii TaxID=213783 RepID=UPI0037370C0D
MQTTQSQTRRLIAGLSIASIVIYINLYIVQGMLPLVSEQFDVAPAHATLLLSVTSFSMAISLLFYALLSDKVGRRKPIIVSLYLLVMVDGLMIWLGSFEQLMLIRLLQGVLLAAVPAIAMAYFKDMLTNKQLLQAGAIYIAANSVGGIVGRLIGGMMTALFNWQQAMLLLCGLTALGVVIAVRCLPDIDAVRAQHAKVPVKFSIEDFKGFKFHLKDRKLPLIYLLGGMAFMVMVNQYSYIQLHLMQAPFEWGRFEVTLIFLCYFAGTYASSRSAKWVSLFGREPLLMIASVLMFIGTLITLFDTIAAIIAGFMVMSFGFFTLHSSANAWVAERASYHRAKATALYLCSYYLGAALGGPYLLPFWQQANWQGVVLGSVMLLIVQQILVLVLSRHKLQAFYRYQRLLRRPMLDR